jgi:DNA-binding NarL/FixJ family response regulator
MTQPPAAIRIVLVDDQAMIRSGLRMVLASEPDLEVVGEAASGSEALEVAGRRRPDVVLIDVQMPGMDGLETTRRLVAARGSEPDARPRVIILTTFDLDEYVFEALRAGASGFLLKNAPADDLVAAVRVVAAGGSLLAPTVTRRVIETFAARRHSETAAKLVGRLSDREREVLGLMARGQSNREIADGLVLGEATVKTHVGSILGKLDARDRVAAVILAFEAGLVAPGER